MVKPTYSLDQLQLYISKGAFLHPLARESYISQMSNLRNKSKLSLLPIAVFDSYHRKLTQTAPNYA